MVKAQKLLVSQLCYLHGQENQVRIATNIFVDFIT